MLVVTEIANEKLNEYMKDNNVSSPLRVTMMQGGCSGPALGLALDEQKDGDELFEEKNLTFLVEKSLLSLCGEITVDFHSAGAQSGFSINSENPLPGGGCGCNSSSCGSGGCG